MIVNVLERVGSSLGVAIVMVNYLVIKTTKYKKKQIQKE